MLFNARLVRFLRSTSGAVTADYVPAAGVVMGLGLLVIGNVSLGTGSLSGSVQESMESTTVELPSFENAFAGAGASTYVGSPTPPPPGALPGDAFGGAGSGGGSTNPGAGSPTTPGNPGNDAPVGGAGETPNGQDDWGEGTVGQGDAGENAPGETGTDDGTNASGGGNAPATGGSGGQALSADFTFPAVEIPHGSNVTSVVSEWVYLTHIGASKTSFELSGQGDPKALAHNNKWTDDGKVKWGTRLKIKVPPPGQSHTAVIEVAGQIGTFTVSRAPAP